MKQQFLFKIRWSFNHKKDGITITPGVGEDLLNRIEGARLLVRRPDGKEATATVSKLSMLCQHPDERVALCLSDGISMDDVPVGADVFLLSDDR